MKIIDILDKYCQLENELHQAIHCKPSNLNQRGHLWDLTQELQGEIFVESEVNIGTKFRVFLPIIKDAEIKSEASPADMRRGTETILVVDDEEFVSATIARTLKSLGYNVMSSTSSGEALELFVKEKEQIDLVITDFTMPKMTGAQLAEKMLQVNASIPIILMTGYTSAIDDAGAKGLGIKAFLTKPVSKKTLSQTIRNVLDESAL